MFKKSDFEKIREFALSIITLIDQFDYDTTISEHEKADLINYIDGDLTKMQTELDDLSESKVDWDSTL